jgi:hypothetical protein
MNRDTLRNRLERLEAKVEQHEPIVILLSVTDGVNSNVRQAVVSGVVNGASGDWLERQDGETEDDFIKRAHDRCAEIHGSVIEVDVD